MVNLSSIKIKYLNKAILRSFFLILIVMLMSISLVSSAEFDNILSKQDKTFDNKIIVGNHILEKYPPITIKNWFGLPLVGETLVEAYISEHTDGCWNNCYSNIKINLINDGVLIQDIKFSKQPIDYKIYIKEETEQLINDYEYVCSETGKLNVNGTNEILCEDKVVGNHLGMVVNWIPYNIGDEVKAGTYEVKLTGQKQSNEIIDWQIKIQGKWTTDWAPWTGAGTGTLADPYQITSWAQLNETHEYLTANFTLMNDLGPTDVGYDTYASSLVDGGKGWYPIGILTTAEFNGTFEGNGHSISGLYINRDLGVGGVGLFGAVSGNFKVQNLSVLNANVSQIGASDMVGALVGALKTPSFVLNCYSTGNINGSSAVGGLVGQVFIGATINNSYSMANVIMTSQRIGGLAGYSEGKIINSFSTGKITNSTGSEVGGLVGNSVGGTVTNSFYDTNLSGVTDTGHGTPNTTIEMYDINNYLDAGWNIATMETFTNEKWKIYDGIYYPQLSWEFPYERFSVTLNSPADNYVSTTSSVDFNCSATITGDATLTNISLWHNQTGTFEINQTNSTIYPGTNTTIFSSSFADGTYLWTCEACDNNSICVFATSNRTINFDTSFPSINIIHPATTEDIGYYNVNQNLSWIITDTTFDSAWYNYNGTNISLNGATNSTTFQLDGNDRNLTFWANDSAGNVNTTIKTWDYKVFVLNETYTATTISGIINKFLLELETNGTQVTLGYLKYNNTNALGSINSSGNYYNLTRNQIAIGVLESTNISFYWNVTMEDGYNFNIASKNQTVNPIIINETCGTGMNVIFNFTVVDEITQTKLNGATENSLIKIDLDLYTSDRTTKLNEFYKNFSQINPVTICIDNNLSNDEQYSIDVQVQYGATNYSSEFYNIERYVLNSSTFSNNITLYNLDNTHTQNFRLIARDTSYLPIDGALIQIERKYIEDGVFYISEIPKTDEKGITSASLQLNDIIYNFYIYQNGTLISSFTNVLAICQTPLISSCEIDFNAFNTGISADFTEGEDFDFTLDYNDTSKIITSQFEIPSGEPSTVYLEVIREDTLGTAVCSDTLTSASGTLSCVVPNSFGNSTVMAKLYKDSIEQGKGSIKTDQKPSDIFGVILIMMSVLVMMTLIGIGISDSPVITGVFIVVGLILLFSMNLVENTGFIGATATILFFIIAMILVIIKAARRS